MRIHTIHVPHRKHTKDMQPVKMPTPKSVTLFTSMHIGGFSTPIVKVGDEVAIGQPIAEPTGFVSSYLHATISGKIKSIKKERLGNGVLCDAITIESDGEDRLYEDITPPDIHDYPSFVEAVRKSGVVGLGGAGFPTFVKLNPKDLSGLDTIVINGAECEPYITSDTRTMIDNSKELYEGIEFLRKYLGNPQVVIGIENNKPECIEKLKELETENIQVRSLPSRYPQGGEKTLVYNLLKRIIPEGKLPLDVGVIVLNCSTVVQLYYYFKTGMPLVKKWITVDGEAIKNPMNVIVPIGTSVRDVIAFTGGYKEEPYKILYGGPMMGNAMVSDESPVLKNTNAILAMTKKESREYDPSPCLHCGNCVSHCPMNLCPTEINKAFQKKDYEDLRKLKVNLCIECGCCSYSCPAHRPLVETHKLAKKELGAYLKNQKEGKA